MADKTINELSVVPQIDATSLLVVSQGGRAMSATGAQFIELAQKSVSKYTDEAKTYQQSALNSAVTASNKANEAAISASIAQQYSGNPPKILNGTWWVWNADTQTYIDTKFVAKGPQGEIGPQGPQGETGPQGPQGPQGVAGVAVAANGQYAFNVEDGHLILYYVGNEVPKFSIENGHLYLDI